MDTIGFVLFMIFFIIIESTGMRIQSENECSEHIDCPDNMPACLDSVCMNLCEGGCGIDAICQLRERVTPVCYCPSGMIGDPFVRCWTPNVRSTSYCEDHSDCPEAKSYCKENECINYTFKRCGENALLKFHFTDKLKSDCVCPDNMIGDPLVSCKERVTRPNTGVGIKNKGGVDEEILVNSIDKLTNSTNRIGDILDKLLAEYKRRPMGTSYFVE